MRKLFISLCFSACCSLLAAQTTNPIQEAMANYDYETALMLIDQETPTVPLLYQKGKALKGLGNNLEALSVFQEVVAQDSLNPRAYIEAAECCKSLAKYSEALDYYQNALHINPDNKYARIQYISLLMNMKRYRESTIRDWESVLFPCLSVRLAIVYFFCYFISVMLIIQARTE